MNRCPLALLVFPLAILAACDVGSVTPGGGDDVPGVDAAIPVDAPIPTFAVAVDPPAASTSLGTVTSFTVTLTSSHFAGPVTVAATGAPAGWSVEVLPATITLGDGGTATAQVKVTVPSNAPAAPAGQDLAISATAPAYSASGSAALTVANEFTLNIGQAGGGIHFGAMNGGVVRLRAGTLFHIKNDDTGTAHRIHTGGGIGGFDHQGSDMAPGGSYDVTPTGGSDSFYCHDHGQGSGEVNLVIE
ncbi:MAG: hypothetical protein R3B06_19835 [Kofleriaceae bacterium]